MRGPCCPASPWPRPCLEQSSYRPMASTRDSPPALASGLCLGLMDTGAETSSWVVRDRRSLSPRWRHPLLGVGAPQTCSRWPERELLAGGWADGGAPLTPQPSSPVLAQGPSLLATALWNTTGVLLRDRGQTPPQTHPRVSGKHTVTLDLGLLEVGVQEGRRQEAGAETDRQTGRPRAVGWGQALPQSSGICFLTLVFLI